MAHRILGLDIGKRRIKVAVVDKTVRVTRLIGFDSEPVAAPYGDAELESAIEALLRRVRQPDDVIMAGLPATDVLHRVLSFPFTDMKALTESAAFELESQVPVDLQESIVDEIIVDKREDGCDALVVAAPRARVEARIELLRRVGAEPRQLGLVALSQAHLLKQLPSVAEGTSLLLDVGAAATDAVVVVNGQPRYIRSLSVGSDAVRAAFADQFDAATVEGNPDLLVSHGLLLPPGMPASTPDEATLHQATLRAIGAWLREVRQTLAAWRRGGKPAPDRIVLTGGMAGLRGLIDSLEAMLAMPVVALPLRELEGYALHGAGTEHIGDFGGAAVALALEGASAVGGQTMDFRQGDLAWEGDYKFLRERMPALIAFAVVALCLLAVRTTITYRGLMIEQQHQMAELGAIGKEITGKKAVSFSKLRTELGRTLKVDLAAYYPDLSAIKVLDVVTKTLHEVTEPPEFKPGGPSEAALPGAARPGDDMVAQIVAPPPQLRGIPPLGMTAPPGGMQVRGRFSPPGGRPSAPALGGVGGGGEDGGGEGDEGGGAGGEGGAASNEPFSGHKVELLSVDIDRSKASLRGDCDTQEALLAFQTALEKHPCFHKIKSTSDRITFERHRDWFRFNIGFEIQCPSEEEPKAEADEGEAKASKSTEGGDSAESGDDSGE